MVLPTSIHWGEAAGSELCAYGYWMLVTLGTVSLFITGGSDGHQRWRNKGGHVWLLAGLEVLLSLAVLCGAAGTLVVALLLVNEQRPDGDNISSVAVPVQQDHWLMGRGVVFGFLGWLPTVIALPFLGVMFELWARAK
jgi:hypothetical protein